MFNKDKIAELEEQLKSLQKYYTDLKKDYDNVIINAKAITKERDELKNVVREQNKADLLLNSFKLIDEIKSGGGNITALENTQEELLRHREQICSYVTNPTMGVPYRYINNGLLGSFI